MYAEKSGAMNFYKTVKWTRKRRVILRRDGYMCRECKRFGRATEATTVHHINPIETNPELALVNWNLISLCNECHEAMHNRVTGELTEKGRRWVERVQKIKSDPPT